MQILNCIVVPRQLYEICEQMLVDWSNNAFKQTVSWPIDCTVLPPVLALKKAQAKTKTKKQKNKKKRKERNLRQRKT